MLPQIGNPANTAGRMLERLQLKAFPPERCKGLNVRFGIAKAAQQPCCFPNCIRMVDADGQLS